MAKSRLETLKEFVERDPKDLFARYALAMAYASSKQYEDAIHHFTKLVELDRDYTATYFQLGHVYETLGRAQDARRIYELGIETCERKSDQHTKTELQESLARLNDSSF